MSAVAHPGGHYERYSRLQINRIGLWFFLASEAFLFAALLSARFLILGTFRPAAVNIGLGVVLTIILLASSGTAHWAETSIARGNQVGLERGLLATIALGLLFLALVVYEWSLGFTHFPPATPYGGLFFTITGMHAAHLLSGVVMLALVYLNARKGGFTPESHWGVEGVIKYWHLVDGVWLSVFITLYLVG